MSTTNVSEIYLKNCIFFFELTKNVILRHPFLNHDVIGFVRHSLVFPFPQHALLETTESFEENLAFLLGEGVSFDHGSHAEVDDAVLGFVYPFLDVLQKQKQTRSENGTKQIRKHNKTFKGLQTTAYKSSPSKT